jgi:opacity protein-like surface antigen
MHNSLARIAACTCAAVALLLGASARAADAVSYKAELRSSSEVPPNDSQGKGMVDAQYDPSTMKFSWSVTYSGLTGPATAAHFHGPAKAGANAGPIITLKAPLTSPMNGSETLTKEQAEQLAAGMWYFNVHTGAHPPGEIRGQLEKK